MTEISFARSFLSALDLRPIRLSSDHSSDPRTFPTGIIYSLPRPPSAPPFKRQRTSGPSTAGPAAQAPSGSGTGIGRTVVLKAMKGDADLPLANQGPDASVYDLKSAYAAHWTVPVDKIKLLYRKRPVADSKTLREVLGGDDAVSGSSQGEQAEFGVMLLGGVVPVAAAEREKEKEKEKAKDAKPVVGPSGKELVKTEEFWDDVKGFLVQRLKDEKEGLRLAGVFRKAAGV